VGVWVGRSLVLHRARPRRPAAAADPRTRPLPAIRTAHTNPTPNALTHQHQTNTLNSKQADALRDRVTRTLADMENLRARTARQAADARAFAVQGLARAMLDVADNLERAGEAAAAAVEGPAGNGATSAPPDPAAALASLREGVALTERVLQSAFRGAGIEKYAPAPGDAFDPNEQSALFEVPAPPGVGAGCVAVVTKAGYKLNGRIVRPAEVGVARAAS
jgi:molecular chaperone GrpE